MLEKTLESPLDCKDIKPINPKKISPAYSFEGLMLKLKLQYFSYLMWRSNSFEKPWCWERLKARGEGDGREWDGCMASPTQWTWVWVNSGSWWCTWRPGVLQSMGSQRVRHDWATELNWTETVGDEMVEVMRVKERSFELTWLCYTTVTLETTA